MNIIDVCCRWPGSAHDATIFANSSLYEKLERGDYGTDSVLLGDSAYGPESFICKPHPNPVSDTEEMYQEAQIKTRNVAERTFGVLKRRFPCLAIGMHFNLNQIQDVIVACCILHNFIKESNTDDAIPVQQNEINLQMEISEHLDHVQQGRRTRIQDFLIDNYF